MTGKGWVAGLIGIAVAVAFLASDRNPFAFAESDPEDLPAVSLGPVSSSKTRVAALGRLQPKDGVRTIAGPAQGVAVVGTLFVDEGDRVARGDLLARLDDAELRAARVERSRVELANAEAELARHAKLLEVKVISDSLHDRLALRRDVATAELRLARAELDRVEVRSPIAGQVLTVHARAGERVGSEGILEIGETAAMYAVAEVYESDVGGVSIGAEATVTSDALPRPLNAVVEKIALRVRKQDVLGTDPAARTDARVVEVELRLAEEDVPLAAAYTHLQVEVEIARSSDPVRGESAE